MLRRGGSILLLLCLAAVGSGAVGHLHNLQHAHEDAALLAAAESAGRPVPPVPIHNDSNCLFHAQLHMPMLAVGPLALLILAGLVVAFIESASPQLIPQRIATGLDCRGPPAC